MKRLRHLIERPPQVSVIRLSGVISASGGGIGQRSLSDAACAPLIERAFTRPRLKAVALAINSPGGSPVQSSLIAARIRRLAAEKGVRVYAFCEDVAASGGYWLACAADEIYVDDCSILGSIGVISASFGFQDLIARHGVERRVHTSGTRKSFLDPFRDEQAEDVARLEALQGEMHERFIAHVKSSRGDRLGDGDLFTGEFWAGRRAVELGLADGVAHLVPKMKELYGDKVVFSEARARRPLWQRLGGPDAADIAALADERVALTRFGL